MEEEGRVGEGCSGLIKGEEGGREGEGLAASGLKGEVGRLEVGTSMGGWGRSGSV